MRVNAFIFKPIVKTMFQETENNHEIVSLLQGFDKSYKSDYKWHMK